MNRYQTEQRKKLLKLFKDREHCSLSAQDVYNELADKEISMSAIYRNLADMENEGLICRVEEKNRTGALYHYVNPSSCVGIIHLKCRSCDCTVHLNEHISKMVIGIARDDYKFNVNNCGAYIYGQCENCSQIN